VAIQYCLLDIFRSAAACRVGAHIIYAAALYIFLLRAKRRCHVRYAYLLRMLIARSCWLPCRSLHAEVLFPYYRVSSVFRRCRFLPVLIAARYAPIFYALIAQLLLIFPPRRGHA